MRILFLSRWFPYPADNGSKIRVFNMLRQLSARHEIALLSFYDGAAPPDDAALREVGKYCADGCFLPYQEFRPTSARALYGLLDSRPRYLVDTHNAAMESAAVDGAEQCDLVVASQLSMGPYAQAVRGKPALLEELELGSFAEMDDETATIRARIRSRATLLKLNAYVRRMLPRFTVCTVASEAERANLRRIAPNYRNVEVIPNAVDVPYYDADFGTPCPNTLVFCGALTFRANYDAIHYYLTEIDPALTARVPERTLRVTGSITDVSLAALPPAAGVHYTGYVDDVRPVVAQSWASIVPLRKGGGTRLKILESMALGTPVVSTSKGAEGLDVVDGENILLADEPREFAAKLTRLLQSPELRQRLSAAGRNLVASRYDWCVTGRRLCALVDGLAA
jgi:glycosyltransferase involved in cell wall biosynthesis